LIDGRRVVALFPVWVPIPFPRLSTLLTFADEVIE